MGKQKEQSPIVGRSLLEDKEDLKDLEQLQEAFKSPSGKKGQQDALKTVGVGLLIRIITRFISELFQKIFIGGGKD
jgi:hypothetical protein